MNRFWNSASIRTKVLLPFLGIAIVMSLGASLLVSQLISEMSQRHLNIEAARLLMVGTVILVILINLLILGIYTALTHQLTRRLDLLAQVAEKVSQGDLSQSIPITGDDRVSRLCATFNDMILSLKDTSEKLHIEKNRSEAIFQQLPEGVIVTDAQNRLILANQKAETMFGFQTRQYAGHYLEEALPQLFGSDSDSAPHEIELTGSNGRLLYYEISTSPARLLTQELIGTIIVIHDITLAKEYQALRESFLRTISHELKTPLTSILGFTDLLVREAAGPLSDKQKRYLDIVLRDSKNLSSLIDDLLELSIIEAHEVGVYDSHIVVQSLLDDVIQSVLNTFLGPYVPIRSDIPPNLIIQSDPEKLHKILFHLISNALKFTQEGEVFVSVLVQKSDLLFQVQDTGIGITNAQQAVIFDKFRQAEYSIHREFDGIGLGLPLARELVHILGGKIWVESELGKGATFYFTLPKHRLVDNYAQKSV